ncbi:MAG: hypothetical protein A3A86_05950 [Elusimicrobia bacterium RIFCSPLOWO2_01_FULL_60_11]|nr:MAG: hypothetical protein A3A86_05950 [Elusimicrobia bacterium RIFCSPLOWO2_01_FULL_60_11]
MNLGILYGYILRKRAGLGNILVIFSQSGNMHFYRFMHIFFRFFPSGAGSDAALKIRRISRVIIFHFFNYYKKSIHYLTSFN